MQGFCVFQFLHQCGADQFYRGERRAKLMGRGCHNAAQVGELLLPRQGHLRGQKGLLHRGHLCGHAPGID